jgi:hypothetical protein
MGSDFPNHKKRKAIENSDKLLTPKVSRAESNCLDFLGKLRENIPQGHRSIHEETTDENWQTVVHHSRGAGHFRRG